MNNSLKNCVAVVTGASRGAGKGIALALGSAGATVYVTGRSTKEGDSPLPGTVSQTAEQVTESGGKGIAVVCDHVDDSQVEQLFNQVNDEQQGRLDLLVNNVTTIHDQLIEPGGFWERTLELVDILDIGLRSAYVASYYAAPLMVARKRGLITFTSSFGGVCYMHGPAYGAHKAGLDKFAADMAVDLKEYNVAAISLWPGLLITERTERAVKRRPEQYQHLMATAETPQLTGKVIAALYNDELLMASSGRTLIVAEQAVNYGITDSGDRQPPSHRPMLGDPREPHPAIIR